MINTYIRLSTYKQILKKDYTNLKDVDCILVLGCRHNK